VRVRVISYSESTVASFSFDTKDLNLLFVSEIYNEQAAVEFRERCQIRVC